MQECDGAEEEAAENENHDEADHGDGNDEENAEVDHGDDGADPNGDGDAPDNGSDGDGGDDEDDNGDDEHGDDENNEDDNSDDENNQDDNGDDDDDDNESEEAVEEESEEEPEYMNLFDALCGPEEAVEGDVNGEESSMDDASTMVLDDTWGEVDVAPMAAVAGAGGGDGVADAERRDDVLVTPPAKRPAVDVEDAWLCLACIISFPAAG